jgi:chromate transporter
VPTLAAIAKLFARRANTTFGGGNVTIAVLKREMVERNAWLSQEDFELAYAVSRLTPGTNLLGFCAAAGWMLRRTLGTIVALLAASLPCATMVVLATVFAEELAGSPLFVSAMHGALAASVALVVASVWQFAEAPAREVPLQAAVVMPLAIAIPLGLEVQPIFVILGAAALGLAWPVGE